MGAKANRSGREHESRDSQSDSVALQGGMHTESKSQEYVVQRRVGYEFEAQWNVRDVSDMEQAETVKEVAKSERERTVHVELAKRLARQPNNTGPFTVTFNEDELGENEQERMGLWFADDTALSHAGEDLMPRVDHSEATDSKTTYFGMIQSMYVNKTLNEPPLLGANVPKATAFVRGTNFDLTADASPTGGSNLEWVTEPLTRKTQVASVMSNIVAMATSLNRRKADPFIPTEDVTAGGGTPDPNLRIYPDGDELLFAPQLTAGLDIGKMSNLIDYIDRAVNEDVTGWWNQNLLSKSSHKKQSRRKKAAEDLFGKGDFSHLKTANTGARREVEVSNIGRTANALGAGVDELIGLITILGNYLLKAEAMMDKDNSKAIAGAMMARTDFAHNFSLLPGLFKEHFAEHPDEFVDLALKAVGYENRADERIFPHTIEKGMVGNTQEVTISLTRREWLHNIPAGFDLLKNYVNLPDQIKPDENEPDQENLISQKRPDFDALHKSLGALGSVDDLVGPENAKVNVLVVELRRMRDNLRVGELKPIALSSYELIDRLNKGKELKYKK